MKINNVEKFREELYTAFKDAYIWNYITEVGAVWKGNVDDYKETMNEYNHYEIKNGKAYRISLAQPIEITNNGKKIYLTVDNEGVNFYRSTEEEFVFAGDLGAEWYKNKMSFVMALVATINRKVNK